MTALLEEWKWIVGGLLVAALIVGVARLTHKVDKVEVVDLQHQVKDASAAAAEAQGALQNTKTRNDTSGKVDASMAHQEAEKQVVYQTVIKEVTKYVENPAIHACSLDDNWLHDYNAALGTSNQGPVPGSASSPAAESRAPSAASGAD